MLHHAISSWLYHAYSIWLFTLSDLKSIVGPQAAFGIINALVLSIEADGDLRWAEVLSRTPVVAFWVWINLLPLTIDNQRQPESILEDKHNKPWRAIPSGRMTGAQAKALMFCLYPVTFLASFWLGGLRQCLGLMALGYAYNDANLAERSWVTRNLINGMAFCCFASGALEVAIKTPISSDQPVVLEWLAIIGAVVSSTVQTQDLEDQIGDRLRGRISMPLSVGDGPTRWLTAVLMLAWSVACPLYWGAGLASQLLIGGLGMGVACRTLAFRSVVADKRTFRLWNAWMAGLYLLPLLAVAGA